MASMHGFLVIIAMATGFFLHASPVINAEQNVHEFPCKIINATFVNCDHLNLVAVPVGIPVSTEILLLSHNKIHIIDSSSFATLANLKSLDLSYNILSKLSGACFANQSKMEHLYLSHNQINSIPPDTFLSSAKIQTLDLSYQNNGLKNALSEYLLPLNQTLSTLLLNNVMLGAVSFANSLKMKALRILNLAQNKIEGLLPSDFTALAGLQMESLDLSFNQLAYIDPKAFSMIPRIGTLNFTHSFSDSSSPTPLIANISLAAATSEVGTLVMQSLGLTILSSTMFPGLDNSTLAELDFSVNRIAKLDNESFGPYLSRVAILRLQFNSISEISTGALTDLTSLTLLNLSSNLLTEITPGIFNKMETLQELYLNNNSIKFLSQDGPFTGLIHLKILHLSKNILDEQFLGGEFQNLTELIDLDLSANTKISLTENSFKHLDSLKYLSLRKVKLKRVDLPSPFASMRAILFLDLSNNNMDYLNQNSFINLQSLQILYLDHNHIDNMWYHPGAGGPSMFLRGLISLKTLDLSSNGLQGIPDEALEDLKQLKSLHLGSNQLSVISSEVFKGLKEIEYLDLHKNKINVVNETLLTPILNTLHTLAIYSNPFSCGCEQQWFRNWLDTTTVIIVNENGCLCESPPDWRNKRLLDYHPDVYICNGKLSPTYVVLISVSSAILAVFAIILITKRWSIYCAYLILSSCCQGLRKKKDYEQIYDYDVFISHSSGDEKWVLETLAPELESGDNPFRLCLHKKNFKPGEYITCNIITSVDCSKRTICIITENFLKSSWCSFERKMVMCKLFVKYEDALILIILEEIPQKKLSKYDKIHRFMKKKTYLQWPGESASDVQKEVFWCKLKAVLNKARTPETANVTI